MFLLLMFTTAVIIWQGITLEYPTHPNPNPNPNPNLTLTNPNPYPTSNPNPKVGRVRGLF